ncbi:MAG: hypothetical protein WCE48_02650 [Steroidobacteraceae bacterium]
MRVAIITIVVAACWLALAGPLRAAETITYKYDAKGRLVKVVHSGAVNNGITTLYTHDKTNNRTNLKTTGASH